MSQTTRSVISNLPEFEVEVSKDFPDYLKVWCPYDDCQGDGRPFLVHKRWARPIRRISVSRKAYFITGRPCTYCSRVSRVTKPSRSR